MKIAILSVTDKGKKISDKLYDNLLNDSTVIHVKQYHKNIKKTIENIFNMYDCIIAIMASGIIIRSIAPHVESKLSDPAVLLIDDNANFVISLLSGHLGGANDLTLKISSIINSTPVITTSTDVNNKIGIDVIAKKFYCSLENTENIQYINNALVNDKLVDLYLPAEYSFILLKDIKNSYDIHIDDDIDYIKASFEDKHMILRPKNLVMGIGARKDIKTDKVKNAIMQACNTLEIPVSRINYFATASVKEKEKGILESASFFNKNLKIVSMDDIKSYQNDECSKSDFVMKQFGIKGVCEPTCLMANGNDSHLIFRKTAYDGVTIAVSIE